MPRPSSSTTVLFSGLDGIRDDAIAYLRRSVLTSPRPILITGGKGCGKTSVVKALAASLEIDKGVLAGKLRWTLGHGQR